ncbi:anaerobic ribonucleoside-triphosphate reductase activating protein [Muribaculaceae bacterium Isolate-002 (NCI)]|nr:anaerobic ribonucleoside-triphosphate reductase activating protein [Muribaculaceae bacterium Isolate-002 (NCI)]
MEESIIRVIDIVPGTSVDGPGLRTSIYVAGCRHRCAGCHNPQTWDFSQGVEMTVSDIMEVIEENGFNVTLTGGDPLYSLPAITPLVIAVAKAGYTIWLYTGFTYSRLLELPGIEKILPYIEAIVDGPFEADKRDASLHFRGSSNQRIIDVKKSLASGEVVTFEY